MFVIRVVAVDVVFVDDFNLGMSWIAVSAVDGAKSRE